MLGAAIVLPDHPGWRRESLGNLFDNTEIEEALLLHVHALSDYEREEIADQDPAVREMIERAEAATPEDIIGLHGRLEMKDPDPKPEPGHPNPGEARARRSATRTLPRRAARSSCGPATDRDVYDKMLDGRTGDDRADLPRLRGRRAHRRHRRRRPRAGALRETGRYLFFKPRGELEVDRDWQSRAAEKQILVAGVGNAWMRDDGFGGDVAKRLLEGELPPGVSVSDFGTGGLDLAYEVMRGYDALILVDVEPPGRRAGDALRDGAGPGGDRGRSRTARSSTRTAWTRRPCCASSRRSAAGRAWSWSSPASRRVVEEMGLGLSSEVARAVDGAVRLVRRADRGAAVRRGLRAAGEG